MFLVRDRRETTHHLWCQATTVLALLLRLMLVFGSAHLVVGWPSTPEVIIVHCWQVVMYEGHGVHHLNSTRSGHGLLILACKCNECQAGHSTKDLQG
jgi:hypothetical protein